MCSYFNNARIDMLNFLRKRDTRSKIWSRRRDLDIALYIIDYELFELCRSTQFAYEFIYYFVFYTIHDKNNFFISRYFWNLIDYVIMSNWYLWKIYWYRQLYIRISKIITSLHNRSHFETINIFFDLLYAKSIIVF